MDGASFDLAPGQESATVQQIAWGRLMKNLAGPQSGRFKIYGGNQEEIRGIEDEEVLDSAVALLKQKISEHPPLFGYYIYVGREEQEGQKGANLCIFAEKTEILAQIFLCT